MRRAMRFFSVKQMSDRLNIGRKTPKIPLSIIKHELEEERQLVGDAIVSQRLNDEKIVLDALEQQQAEYKRCVKQSVDELMENPPSTLDSFHAWWQQKQNMITFYIPKNNEVLADSIDWLRARQALARQHQGPDVSMDSHAEFSLKKT